MSKASSSPKIISQNARANLSKILVPKSRKLSTQGSSSPSKLKAAASFTLPQLLKQSFSSQDQNLTAVNDSPAGLKASKSINKSSENLYRIINVQKVNEFVDKSRKRPILKNLSPALAFQAGDFIDEEPEPFDLDDDDKSEMSGFNLYKRRSRHTASSINLTTAPKYALPASPKITFNLSSKSPILTSNLSPLYKFTEEGFALDKLETHKTQEQSFLSLEKRGSTEYSPKKQAAESSILTRQASTGIFSSDLSPSKKSFSKDGRSSHIYTFDNKNGFSLKSSIQNPLPSLPKRNFTLAYLDGPATQTNITQEDIYASQSRLSLSPERKPVSPPNPLSNLVKFEDGKIPFHLALNAEARRKMIEEVKKKPSERADLGSIMELRDKKIPEATAEFLGKLTDVETKKIEGDFRSRSPQRNTIYHLHALDKKTKTRVMAKLQKQLTQVSRYLNS